jgi:hypothetical protein
MILDLDWTPEGAAELHATDEDLQSQIDALVGQSKAQATAIAALEKDVRKKGRRG